MMKSMYLQKVKMSKIMLQQDYEKNTNVARDDSTLVLSEYTSSRAPDAFLEELPIVEKTPCAFRTTDHIIAFGVTLFLTSLIAFGSVTYGMRAVEMPRVSETAYAVPEEEPVPPTEANPYENVRLNAVSYIVYDVHADRVLVSKRADEPRPIASLTKIMTALVALEFKSGDAHIPISQYAIDTEGDSGLIPNERWRLRDLVSFMMLTSSNDGAEALASVVGGLLHSAPEMIPEYKRVDTFVAQMNTRSQELGLNNTFFRNPTGLDTVNGREGGQASAKDMARLIAYAWEHAPEIFESTTELTRNYTSIDGNFHTAHNTNYDVTNVYGIMGSKTGYTDIAGGNLGVLYDSSFGHPVVVVVLGSSREARFSDVQTLIDATYEYIEKGWYAYEVAGSTPKAPR
jgi:D-alanyl-D-alanine carboxypeptidase